MTIPDIKLSGLQISKLDRKDYLTKTNRKFSADRTFDKTSFSTPVLVNIIFSPNKKGPEHFCTDPYQNLNSILNHDPPEEL